MLCISILAPVACYTAEVVPSSMVLQPVPDCFYQLFRCSRTTHADCCIHFWCHKCAQCQEMRELKARGDLQRGTKPKVGPQCSNSGASSPTSPVDQKLQPLHMQAPVPAAAPPAHQHCPQVPSSPSNCSILLQLTEDLFYTRNEGTTSIHHNACY
jgi:hypothetical protein